MKGALIILGFLIVVGVILYLFDSRMERKGEEAESRLPPRHRKKDDEGNEGNRKQGEERGEEGKGEERGEEGKGEETGEDGKRAEIRKEDAGIEDEEGEDEGGSECCGLHLVCEKDSLSPMSAEVEYYDDEELDRFIGRSGNDYSPEEVEEFRDVLMTLRADDIAGWGRSITARRLELPPEVRDEFLMLVNEQRNLRR